MLVPRRPQIASGSSDWGMVAGDGMDNTGKFGTHNLFFLSMPHWGGEAG